MLAAMDVSASIPFEAMGSRCEVRIDGAPDEAAARAWSRAAIDEVRRIEAKYSRYRGDSVVSAINRAAGGAPVAVDPETRALLGYADALWRDSGGRFDATSGVLRRAWDFGRGTVPDEAALAALRPLIDWPSVERDGDRVRLPRAGMELDFGGFGKEYAADRAAEALRAAGARHGFVDLGGDIRAIGPRADGTPWSVAIRHPREPDAVVAAIDVADGAVCTSGDYERFVERDGVRHCHVLDPRTGRSVRHWRSVTVVAPVAVAAGGYTTVAMLLEAAAIDYLERTGLPWLAIGPDGAPVSSPGLG
ncbi:MAG TPA: FAD:protein FMN transferase [Burkholderiaceae bacterium]|nr:FAD:protein FMN transferase [Burkholderiaceae bacterium]